MGIFADPPTRVETMHVRGIYATYNAGIVEEVHAKVFSTNSIFFLMKCLFQGVRPRDPLSRYAFDHVLEFCAPCKHQ